MKCIFILVRIKIIIFVSFLCVNIYSKDWTDSKLSLGFSIGERLHNQKELNLFIEDMNSEKGLGGRDEPLARILSLGLPFKIKINFRPFKRVSFEPYVQLFFESVKIKTSITDIWNQTSETFTTRSTFLEPSIGLNTWIIAFKLNKVSIKGGVGGFATYNFLKVEDAISGNASIGGLGGGGLGSIGLDISIKRFEINIEMSLLKVFTTYKVKSDDTTRDDQYEDIKFPGKIDYFGFEARQGFSILF